MKHQTADGLGLLDETDKPTKTPWFLRMPKTIQPIRQRLNQWNWRQKTALVTALTITDAGTFYPHRAHAAAFLWPFVIGRGFLLQTFASYGIGKALDAAFNTKVQKTANANTEDWLYDYREHHLTFKENGAWRSDGEDYTRIVHATATAVEVPSHDTSGTDSYLLELGYSSDALTKSEVLYEEVDDNANLSGTAITYDVEELVDGVWDTLEYDRDWRTGSLADKFLYVTYGGYIPEPIDAELQKQLDDFRSNWNAMASTNRWMYSNPMGTLRVGVEIRSTKETFVCNKAVKLWSKFDFNRIPGDTDPDPKELQTPGGRPNYVTSFSYIAREAGYSGGIVTRVLRNERTRTEYPEPFIRDRLSCVVVLQIQNPLRIQALSERERRQAINETTKKGEPRNEKCLHHCGRHSGHDGRCPPRAPK